MATPFEDPPIPVLSVTVHGTELGTYLGRVSSELRTHSRAMSTLTEEIKQVRAMVDNLKTQAGENWARINRSLSSQDTQLRVLTQHADKTVSKPEFDRNSATMRDAITNVEAQLEAGMGGKKLENAVRDIISAYEEQEGIQRVQDQINSTVQNIHDQLQRSQGDLQASLTAAIETKANQHDFTMSLDSLRDESNRTKRQAIDEVQAVKKHLVDTEKQFDRQIDGFKSTVATKLQKQSGRIRRFYDMMSMEDPEPYDEEEDGSAPAAAGEGGARRATAGSPARGPPSGTPSPGVLSPRGAASRNRPISETLTDETNSAEAEEERIKAVLNTPVFINLRHLVLKDIAERVGTSVTAHSNDVDEELLDVRNNLKSYATPARVLELIHQQADRDTPRRVAAIEKVLEILRNDKVDRDEFHEGLRSKADILVVDTKADRSVVIETVDTLKRSLADAHSNLDELNGERAEFREVLRDVLYIHRRSTVQHEAMAQQLGVDTRGALNSSIGREQTSPTRPDAGGEEKVGVLPALHRRSPPDEQNQLVTSKLTTEMQRSDSGVAKQFSNRQTQILQESSESSVLKAASATPTIEDPVAALLPGQGLDPRPPSGPDAMLYRDEGASRTGTPRDGASRQGLASRQGSKRSVRPLTDSRASSRGHDGANVSSTPQGLAHPRTWSPRSTTGNQSEVQGSDSGAVIPLTSSQRGYARTVGADQVVGGRGGLAGSTKTSTARGATAPSGDQAAAITDRPPIVEQPEGLAHLEPSLPLKPRSPEPALRDLKPKHVEKVFESAEVVKRESNTSNNNLGSKASKRNSLPHK